jgi:hypothetical protein
MVLGRHGVWEGVGSEIMAEEMIDIADGTMDEGTVPEDTKRAKLRIETRASIIAFNNKSLERKNLCK